MSESTEDNYPYDDEDPDDDEKCIGCGATFSEEHAFDCPYADDEGED